jgi:hypothetical protein
MTIKKKLIISCVENVAELNNRKEHFNRNLKCKKL